MAVQCGATSAPAVTSQSPEIARIYQEGIIAGVIGAATIAVWFFVIDSLSGRPFSAHLIFWFFRL